MSHAITIGARTHPTLYILFPAPETVFKEGVDDTADTERWFDNIRYKFTD
jgi:hypothetical protein